MPDDFDELEDFPVDEDYPGVSSFFLPDDEIWSDMPDVYCDI